MQRKLRLLPFKVLKRILVPTNKIKTVFEGLVVYCNQIWKEDVHLRSMTLLLFGKGKRWDNYSLYNDYWVCSLE